MAAAISAHGTARDLVTMGLRGECRLVVSELVYQETERNLAAKAPQALPAFHAFRDVGIAQVVTPRTGRVLRVVSVVHPKDAPIVAAALHARAHFLATFDRKHLLAQRDPILTHFALPVILPEEIVSAMA